MSGFSDFIKLYGWHFFIFCCFVLGTAFGTWWFLIFKLFQYFKNKIVKRKKVKNNEI